MFVFLQFYSVDKSYTTYLDVDKFIHWIALSKLSTTEMTQGDKFYSPVTDLSTG